MRALIDLLLQYKHWLVFILLEIVSLLLLFSYNGYQKSVYFTTANDVVGVFYSATSSVSSYLNLQTENKMLEEDNQRLMRENYQLKQRIAEAKLDSLKPKGLPPYYNIVNAQVVKSTVHKANNLITINKGESDGIKPEMGVISSHGVVGIVYMTSSHYSIVMPLLNKHSMVSCRLKGTEHFGTLNWQRESPYQTYSTGIPRHAKVKKGDVMETNGYSAIFPPGIPIGVVSNIGDSSDGMSYLLTVNLYTDFTTLREVSVITDYIQAERIELEEKADSLNTES
ncbi:MAG: rod shape-determining protein MreC [Bacteroidaceae bacterium]|nr:rod shape-determining protein MreC [Bacteroidaceae bacterium]